MNRPTPGNSDFMPVPFANKAGSISGPEVPVTPTPGIHNNPASGSSYFPTFDNGMPASRVPQTPGTADAEASAARRKDELTDSDPKRAFEGLSLTGSVISATFCLPYTVGYKGSEWVRNFPIIHNELY